MASKGNFQIDARFKKRLKGRFERFSLEAGVLNDKPHKLPKPVTKKLKKKKPAQSQATPKPARPKPKEGFKAKLKKKVAKTVKKAQRRFESKAKKAARKNSAMVKANAARGLGTMEGGPVRLKLPKTRGTNAQIAEFMRTVHGIPYLTAPFQNQNSKEMRSLRVEFLKLIVGKTKGYSKIESLLRAVIRTPFLKKRYGRNSEKAKKVKTFDRLGIDTGQVFRALEGRVRVNKNVPK